ncbi:MAG: hypothetical protein RL291_1005 [Pseudomonadota bacterium]
MTNRLWANAPLLLTATAIMWAGNTIAGRLAVGHISPFTLTCLRWTIVIAVLWPLYGREVRERWGDIQPKVFRIAAMGALGFTGFNALYYAAAHHTTAINIGILQGVIPVLVLLGAFVAFGTRVTIVQALGTLVTLCGVVVVATKGMPAQLLALNINPGDIAVFIACVLYAFYTVALKDRPTLSGQGFFTLMALFAMLTSLPLIAYEAAVGQLTMPTPRGFAILLWVAFFPSYLSQIFFLRGVDLIGPGRAGVFVNLVPVFSAIMAVGLINEPFGWYHGVALSLVFGGIWLTQRSG